MLRPVYTSKFNKDLKKLIRQGKDINKFKFVAENLINQIKLETKYKDHKLIGPYKDRRDCHIEPD